MLKKITGTFHLFSLFLFAISLSTKQMYEFLAVDYAARKDDNKTNVKKILDAREKVAEKINNLQNIYKKERTNMKT